MEAECAAGNGNGGDSFDGFSYSRRASEDAAATLRRTRYYEWPGTVDLNPAVLASAPEIKAPTPPLQPRAPAPSQ